MTNILFPFLISALMGMGIGGELASLKEGCYDTRKLVFASGMYASTAKQVAGGPQGKDFIYRITSKAVEGVFFYV